MKVDVSHILTSLRPGIDLVVKADDLLPLVEEGSDIDIYTLDSTGLEFLLSNQGLRPPFNLVQVREINQSQKHLDFYVENVLFLKIDIYSGFPKYDRVKLKSELFQRVVITGRTIALDSGVAIPIPDLISDALIRYIEYVNFFWVGPDKIKHLDWLLKHLDDSQKELFLWNLHRYVETSHDFVKIRDVRRSKTKQAIVIVLTSLQRVEFFKKRAKKLVARFPRIESYIEKTLKGM